MALKKLKDKIYCECKVRPLALGLTFGILCAFAMIFLTLWAKYTGGGTQWVSLIANVYWGYDMSIKGTLIGSAWAFGDGLFGGVIIGLLYNGISKLVKH